jgi:hypothetical protein
MTTKPPPLAVRELAVLLGAPGPRRIPHGFGTAQGEWTVEPTFVGFSDPPPAAQFCFGKRSSCLRDDDARMSCVEVEITKRLRATGWSGGWLNTYGGDPPQRWLEWTVTSAELARLLPAERAPLARWLESDVTTSAGFPDVFVVRGLDLLAIECKRHGAAGEWSDSVRATQTNWSWRVIGDQALLAPDELVVVWWSRRPAPADPPAVPSDREPTRKYPAGRSAGSQAGSSSTSSSTRTPRAPSAPDRAQLRDQQEGMPTVTSLEPSDDQKRAALGAVTDRGWSRTDAAGHAWRPNGWRGPDGGYVPCELCRARTNPARWPLFFTSGPEAGRLLWTCSTCKLKQVDRTGAAKLVVDIPPA